MKMNYYRMLDKKHKGMVLRVSDQSEEYYKPGHGWTHIAIYGMYLLPYDDNDLYDMYEEITEEEALAIINAA